jgi:O-antigen ligase
MKFRNLARVYLWSSTFQMARDNPILGVGAGNFKVAYPLYRSSKESETIPKGVKYSQAHNDFLEVWAETGTLGLICFLGILFSLMPFILHPLAQRDGPASHLCLGLCCGLIILLVQALFNPLLSIPSSGMAFWMLVGLIVLTGTEMK